MNRNIIWIVVIIVVGSGLYWWTSNRNISSIIVQPKLTEDIYPLYNDAEWGIPVSKSMIVGTTTYDGASITSQTISADMNPGGILMPFERYYDAKLKALGWSVANDLAAGGPVGGQTGYSKGDDTILIGFRINYSNQPKDAPSECPCDVSFSIFSTE